MAILGSRDQLCVNPSLSDCSGIEKTRRCQKLVQNKECKYYSTYEQKRDTISKIYQAKLMDIEDWVSEGKAESFCTYYASRNLIHNANLVVMPFETLVDQKSIELMSPYFNNAVIVIEDADLFEGFILEVN